MLVEILHQKDGRFNYKSKVTKRKSKEFEESFFVSSLVDWIGFKQIRSDQIRSSSFAMTPKASVTVTHHASTSVRPSHQIDPISLSCGALEKGDETLGFEMFT